MKSLREAIIERINEKYIGRTFTAASFYDLPECSESDYPNIAIAKIICSLADRRGYLKRTGEKRRIKVNTKPLAVFTTVGTLCLWHPRFDAATLTYPLSTSTAASGWRQVAGND